jgi:isocitrate/isopropylmalate dehydrogenase
MLLHCDALDPEITAMKILVLPGDGIGPEITAATLAVLDRANAKFRLGLEWQMMDIGLKTLKSQGSTLPESVMEAARKAPGIILGPVDHLQYPEREKGGINPSGELRVKLDLFANIRPAKSRMGVGLTGKPVDLVIFRECTEGFYADRNISDGLFLREVRKVAKEYPDVELDEKIVDAMAALLVRDPSRFDCIVTGNMFGDILSDEASEISGSLGLAGSTMAGDDACCAQAQHGSAPDIQGQDKANPTSLILSAAMLLEWLAARHQRPEFDQAAKAIEAAIDAALQSADTRTPDLKGRLGTKAFGKHISGLVG